MEAMAGSRMYAATELRIDTVCSRMVLFGGEEEEEDMAKGGLVEL